MKRCSTVQYREFECTFELIKRLSDVHENKQRNLNQIKLCFALFHQRKRPVTVKGSLIIPLMPFLLILYFEGKAFKEQLEPLVFRNKRGMLN